MRKWLRYWLAREGKMLWLCELVGHRVVVEGKAHLVCTRCRAYRELAR